MFTTPVTKEAVKASCQLETVICDRLAGDPETLRLFVVYVGLLDALAGGTSGGALLVSYDDLVQMDLDAAHAALADVAMTLNDDLAGALGLGDLPQAD